MHVSVDVPVSCVAAPVACEGVGAVFLGRAVPSGVNPEVVEPDAVLTESVQPFFHGFGRHSAEALEGHRRKRRDFAFPERRELVLHESAETVIGVVSAVFVFQHQRRRRADSLPGSQVKFRVLDAGFDFNEVLPAREDGFPLPGPADGYQNPGLSVVYLEERKCPGGGASALRSARELLPVHQRVVEEPELVLGVLRVVIVDHSGRRGDEGVILCRIGSRMPRRVGRDRNIYRAVAYFRQCQAVPVPVVPVINDPGDGVVSGKILGVKLGVKSVRQLVPRDIPDLLHDRRVFPERLSAVSKIKAWSYHKNHLR